MRMLFTFAGGIGHFLPLAIIARAAQKVGHSVLFAGGKSSNDVVVAEGFESIYLGARWTKPPEPKALRPLDEKREIREFVTGFIGANAQERMSGAKGLIQQWTPDVLVCDETDFGCIFAAEARGLPCATVNVLASGSFPPRSEIVKQLDLLRIHAGLEPDPGHNKAFGKLILSPVPSTFRNAGIRASTRTIAYFPTPVEPKENKIGPLFADPSLPLAYATLGTVFNLESGDLFQRIIAAVKDLPMNTFITCGKHIEPDSFGPQPPNVVIQKFVPQDSILPFCAVVISHAGSGSTLGALAHGVPSVFIPMGADQPNNAERCRQLGCAVVLDPISATAESIRDAVKDITKNPIYRGTAQQVIMDYRKLPDVSKVVSAIANLRR